MGAVIALAALLGIPLLLSTAWRRGMATRADVEVKRLEMLRLLSLVENDLPFTAPQMLRLAELGRDVGTDEEKDRIRKASARL